jgi:hypothetical protein
MTVTTKTTTLPIILVAAVFQGGALYGLHHALKYHHWPFPSAQWLTALYTCAVFVPLTVELLAEHAQRKVMWLLTATLVIAFFYFGWHFGSAIGGYGPERVGDATGAGPFLFAFELVVLWLLVLPFLQSRLALAHWRVEYPALFNFAWRNKITLCEAAGFTGLFWLLLALWQALFHMLQIDFFSDLFRQPLFDYPVTALVFGIAMHLIGSIDRLVSAVLEQLLSLLKWLAMVAGVLLALFTLALLVKLPGLVFEGQKAIGSTWLLWLVAIVVLFLNAAYRDGTNPQPYPRWIGQLLRFVVPLCVVIALTASYSLWIREQHYGLTVERFWAFVVAASALLYAVGYSLSVPSKGAWLPNIAAVNVGVALLLIATLALALTPLASPYRLAANSQYQRILNNRWDDLGKASFSKDDAIHYLRWESGDYGRARLESLTQLDPQHPEAARIRELASAAVQEKNKGQPPASTNTKSVLTAMTLYPKGRTLDAQLAEVLTKDIEKEPYVFASMTGDHPPSGLYVDLNGDGIDEFVIFGCCRGVAYQHRTDGWTRIGTVLSANLSKPPPPWTIETDLGNGLVETTAPAWKDLVIGGRAFRVDVSP